MKTFKQLIFVLILLTIGGISHAARVCNLGELSLDCPLNDDPSGVGNILNQGNPAAAQAEAQRQWQIREDAVQARIAKYRATPAYGAIAVSSMDSSTGWGGGYKTLAESTQVALRACTGSCQIIASFFNTCAGVASLKNSKDPKAVVVATDPDKETALNKALAQCESKFGKGNCGMRNNDTPLCAGYDYGVFPK